MVICVTRVAAHLNTSGRKLHPNRGLRLEIELVASETRNKVRLADSRVADEHHLKQVVVIVICLDTPHGFV